jgi:hypothetical protein
MSIDQIKVFDDFLNPQDLEQVFAILSNTKFEFYHTSNGNATHKETPFWSASLNNEPFISQYIKNLIEKQVFKKLELIRVYCNAQTFGQDGAYHIDTNEPDTYTFVLYVNVIQKHDVDLAGGYLFFKLPDLPYKICYDPLNNRGVFFPSNYIHRSSCFSRFITDLRMSIAFKLKEVKS